MKYTFTVEAHTGYKRTLYGWVVYCEGKEVARSKGKSLSHWNTYMHGWMEAKKLEKKG